MTITEMTDVTVDARAQAVADVQQLHLDFKSAQEEIAQLKADLNRERDRVTILTDERVRFRAESNIYRTKLIELATAMGNIGLLTGQAQTIMLATNELLNEVDGHGEDASMLDSEGIAANKLKMDNLLGAVSKELGTNTL